jgi:hypothetical protein
MLNLRSVVQFYLDLLPWPYLHAFSYQKQAMNIIKIFKFQRVPGPGVLSLYIPLWASVQ